LTVIASKISVDGEKLKEFNKWVKGDEIPSDKAYALTIPTGEGVPDFSKLHVAQPVAVIESKKPGEVAAPEEILINSIPVVQARKGESLSALAERAGLSVSHFLKYNELPDDHRVVAGGYYFTAKKKSRTVQEYHQLKPGEDLWVVSQLHGVQVKRLRKINHLKEGEQPAIGTMIWLNNQKPDSEDTDNQEDVLEVGGGFVEWQTSRKPDGQTRSSHLVQHGETLYSISRMYGLTVDELVSINQLAGTELKPGVELRVLRSENTPPSVGEDIVHEVQLSETLYSVARRYGVTVKELMESNDKTDFSVALGEKLKIPAR
jgi:membrane-bound lytic murein transglycosylase D